MLIDAIGTVEYSEECEGKIDAANQAYDALPDHLKSLVDNADVLTQANDDYYSVQDAISAIKAIGTLYYVDEIKNYIEQARAMVDDLSDHQASILPEEYLKILVDDEAAYEAMDKINAIPLPLENTKDCLDKVMGAEDFFNSLTEDQQSLVTSAFVSKLNDAVVVKDAIEAVNAIAEVENTPEDKDLIDNARELIDAVLDNDKIADLLPDSVVKDLEDKEAVYDSLGVITIVGTPENTRAFRDAVAGAREAYDALTEDQKAIVNPSFVKAFEDAEAIIVVMDKINAIGEVEYTPECKERIDAAREGYDALTEDQKKIFPKEELQTLIDAEKAYETMALIHEIGEVEYTAECKERIEAAMHAFGNLTPAQQEMVKNHLELPTARETYSDLEDRAKANDVETLIAAIGEVVHPESKDAIEKAREAYDELTSRQKEMVGNYNLLTEAESAYADYDEKAGISTAMGWIVFVLVLLEMIYLALYFILWYPKAAHIAETLKLGGLRPYMDKVVLFGFIDLLLLIGGAASVAIFILALAALCVYALPISIVSFVLAFLVMAAYAVLCFFKWKKRDLLTEIPEKEEEKDFIEAETEAEVTGSYHITKDEAGKCIFVLYCGEGDNLSKEMGIFDSEKEAYKAIKTLREKGKDAKAENRLKSDFVTIPAPKFVIEVDHRGVYRYSFVDEKGEVLLQSVQYLSEKRCMQDLKKALTSITTEEVVVSEGTVKNEAVERVEDALRQAPISETETPIEAVAADKVEESSELPAEEPKEEKAEEKVTLKESLSEAKATAHSSSVNKQYVVDYLKLTFGKRVECNTRGNKTKTGLPLADTHYAVSKKGKRCFAYVYETEAASLLLLRLSDAAAKRALEKGENVRPSAFPKAKATWYSVVMEDSLSTDDIHELLNDAYDNAKE